MATQQLFSRTDVAKILGVSPVYLGRLFVKQSEWEKARKVFRSMLLQNLDADAQMSKADVYLQLGRIHASGTPQAIFQSTDPVVQHFVNGISDPKETPF